MAATVSGAGWGDQGGATSRYRACPGSVVTNAENAGAPISGAIAGLCEPHHALCAEELW